MRLAGERLSVSLPRPRQFRRKSSLVPPVQESVSTNRTDPASLQLRILTAAALKRGRVKSASTLVQETLDQRHMPRVTALPLSVLHGVVVRHKVLERRQQERSRSATFRSRPPKRILRDNVCKESLLQIHSLGNVPHLCSHVSVKRLLVLLAQLRESQLSIRSIELPNHIQFVDPDSRCLMSDACAMT